MGEKLPQRFRWVSAGYSRWKYGVLLWNVTHEIWEIHTFGLHQLNFCLDEVKLAAQLSQTIGAVSRFEWIDNDNGWLPLKKVGDA